MHNFNDNKYQYLRSNMTSHEIRVIDCCLTAEQLLGYLRDKIFLYDYNSVYSNKYKVLLTSPFLSQL
jgi:hypothetical protein